MDDVLSVHNVSIAFGGVRALQAVSLAAKRGRVTALIGPNGAGKTTLFNVISGIYPPGSGTVAIDGVDVTQRRLHELAGRGLSRTFQNLRIFEGMSALENVAVGLYRHRQASLLANLLGLPAMRREQREMRERSLALLARVGLAELAERPAASLSYGQMKRLEIARSLATAPRLLLLDEPAAGCNAVETAEIKDLVARLRAEDMTILLVEHDMEMVMSMSDYVYVLDGGRLIAEGPPLAVAHDPAVIEAYLGAETVPDQASEAAIA